MITCFLANIILPYTCKNELDIFIISSFGSISYLRDHGLLFLIAAGN